MPGLDYPPLHGTLRRPFCMEKTEEPGGRGTKGPKKARPRGRSTRKERKRPGRCLGRYRKEDAVVTTIEEPRLPEGEAPEPTAKGKVPAPVAEEKIPEPTTDRDGRGRFRKGNKLGGRKRLPEDVKALFQAAAPEAVRLLIETMENPEVKPELRVRCAETILERVYGKNPQPIAVENTAVQIVLEGDLREYSA